MSDHKQPPAMQVDGDISSFEKIKCGARQGCVLSPDLFSPCREMIMRNLEGYSRIKVGGHNVNNTRYTDDTLLIAENKEDLQQLLDIVEEESRKKGLELNQNSKKTEVMAISQHNECPKINNFITGINSKRSIQIYRYLNIK